MDGYVLMYPSLSVSKYLFLCFIDFILPDRICLHQVVFKVFNCSDDENVMLTVLTWWRIISTFVSRSMRQHTARYQHWSLIVYSRMEASLSISARYRGAFINILDKHPPSKISTGTIYVIRSPVACNNLALYTRTRSVPLLGHRDLRMTKRYAHLNVDNLKRAVGFLDLWHFAYSG